MPFELEQREAALNEREARLCDREDRLHAREVQVQSKEKAVEAQEAGVQAKEQSLDAAVHRISTLIKGFQSTWFEREKHSSSFSFSFVRLLDCFSFFSPFQFFPLDFFNV